MFRALVGAAIGGLIGAALWAAVAFLFNFEIGWLAWGVGVLAGFGAAKACSDLDFSTGVAAAGMAVLAIALGKYVTVHFVVQDYMEEVASQGMQVSDELAISFLADDVIEMYAAEGTPMRWPGGMPPENPTTQVEYPPEVWSVAQADWSSWSPAEQNDYKAQLRANAAANIHRIEAEAMQAGFRASFSGMDVLFVLLAMGSAYKIGSGATAEANA